MRLGTTIIVGLLLATLAKAPPVRAQGPGLAGHSSTPLASRDPSFRIPFDIDSVQRPRIREVQLHYSGDLGQSWRHYTNADPSESSFLFTSPKDGEYWFAVRTMDHQGNVSPANLDGIEPGLRVRVDTRPPTVKLRGQNPVGDEVGISWIVDDEDLDVASLRAEYRVGPSSPWIPIAVQPQESGSANWRPEARGGEPIEIRLRVSDRAGNEATKSITLQTPQGIPAFSRSPARPNNAPAAPRRDNPWDRDRGFAPPPPNLNRPRESERSAFDDRSRPQGRFVPYAPADTSRVPDFRDQAQNSRTQPPNQSEPWNQDRFAGARSQQTPRPTIRPLLVNSTRFGINYGVEELGKSGLSSVDLYYLDPRSWQWEYYGEDEDREAPFLVEVDGEGVYGITLVAKNGAGLGQEPPAAGDQPETWIEVDLTPPDVELHPPEPGQGAAEGILSISWSAQDRNLAAKAISLSYSETLAGPWEPIAKELKNTGRYQWRMPDEVPYRFYVRLEAADRAGNVGRAETDAPVIVDLKRPRLKIMGVEPSGEFDQPPLP
ncbi:hypothetical protein Pan216_21670 [Planctomycetes bacterium Pan216]|uniref:Ser-Thr-rich glycosyl-phosphatidyl-inositol-anchored membrane family protein n=1 Tax=Kolteria novifilia TaxID=2527975 RepID=A0A518B2Z1_9BACT|nr:hypothetical protein Pan216_21670 [Planctomycetes bacterium Pan216]